MPELPEVETVRRQLADALVGRTVERVTLRRADIVRGAAPRRFCATLRGRTIEALDRRGKALIVRLSDDVVLLVHLGMTGRFCLMPKGAPLAEHTHMIAQISGGLRLIFCDPRRFGHLELTRADALAESETLRHVGIDVLAPEFTADALAEALAGRKAPIKAALLDQRRFAGIGNIYACEALFRARIHPTTPCGALTRAQVQALYRALRAVMRESIAAEGTTIADYVTGRGVPGGFQHRLRVYGREGERCPTRGCPGTIARIVQSNRSTFYCPVCQRA
jgi:formamidopyrimidine-DNA glycosylase